MLEAGVTPGNERPAAAEAAFRASLAAAQSCLDILEACDRYASETGSILWTVGAIRPTPCAFAYGPVPVRDSAIRDTIARGADVCDTDAARGLRPANSSLLCRWTDAAADPVGIDSEELVQVPLVAGGVAYGVMQAVPMRRGVDCSDLQEVLHRAAVHAVLSLEQMGGMALLDPLTGLWSADEFRRRVEVEVERAHSYPAEFSLAMLEIQMGPDRNPGSLTEKELRAVGEIIVECLRRSDSAARLEDGRFALLLPMTNQRDSFIAVARVTDRLREHPDLSPELTCGVGVSGWTFEGSSGHELFRQAAAALEDAKAACARGAFVFL